MTLLDLPTAGTARRSVTLLSGFLGSGKTTLLRAELDRAGGGAPAVVVNDFAATGVDDVLLGRDGVRPVTVTGGCACCTRREELADGLRRLLDDEQRTGRPRRDVVVETSGLSDPGPIAFTVASDPVLRHHYALGLVHVTVDAVTGLPDAGRHPVALRQVLAADHLVVTKADLAAPEDVDALVRRLHGLNPTAPVSVTAGGELLRTEPAPGGRRPVPAAVPIDAVPIDAAPIDAAPTDAMPTDAMPIDAAHTEDVATVELSTGAPLDWEAFAVWLSLLLHRHGPDVLRVKGVLDVDGAGPVAVHGVQHVVHRPEHLPGAADGSRLVLITRGIDPGRLEHSFRTFLGI
jgi:G3E family GTPase